MDEIYVFTRTVNQSWPYGPAIEQFLDRKLNRQKHNPVSVPSYISQDSDFADMEDEDIAAAAAAAAEADSDDLGSVSVSIGNQSAFAMPSAGLMYRDLPRESRTLDGLLYNALLMNVKGSANTLLECVQHPSYIQGMIVLVKHIDVSRSDRKTRAFEGVDQIKFREYAHAYQIEAITAVSGIIRS